MRGADGPGDGRNPGPGDAPGTAPAGGSSAWGDALVPEALREFLELYAAGRFWDSHEVLEGPWRDSGSAFYQGLILYASAWVHWERRNAHGVRAQLRKALERWDPYPASYLGLDLDGLRRHARSVREVVEADPEGWAERVGPLPMDVEADRIRGDETEAGGPGPKG